MRCGRGGGAQERDLNCDLLVFSEKGSLVRGTNIWKHPEDLVWLGLFGSLHHGPGTTALPSFFYQLPDVELFDLHKNEFGAQGGHIWKLFSKAQHNSTVGKPALVVIEVLQLSEELAGVEDLDHLVTLQLVGPVLAHHSVATVEHAALAQPLDQHTLPAAVQQYSTLQVPKQLSCHLPLPLAGDGVRWREAHQLQALEPVHFDTGQTWLAQGQAATLRASGGGLAHQLAPVVEADDHLGEG